MKHVILSLSLVVLLTGVSMAQQRGNMSEKKQNMKEMMQDSSMRAMMMDQMMNDPEMRANMMQRMMDQDQKDRKAMMQNMGAIVKNPAMKKRMRAHMKIMQAMLDDEMDHEQMMDNMGDSEMMNMNMHMRCMQIMDGGKMMQHMNMGSDSTSNKGMMKHDM